MGMMRGKRGVILGVANDHSIAWGIAQVLAREGAEIAFTFQGEAFGRRVRPLAQSLGSTMVYPADVTDEESLDRLFVQLGQSWDSLDFLVHAIAWSDREQLKGRYIATTRENFLRTLDISCYSFTDVLRRALPMMKKGGSAVTLTYLGSQKVMPNYNVMGVAKAALEASVRYLANDVGERGVRVNAISSGPVRTLAGAAIGSARQVFSRSARIAPLGRNVALEEIGGAALYLLSDLGSATTGDILYVDSGFHMIGMDRVGLDRSSGPKPPSSKSGRASQAAVSPDG